MHINNMHITCKKKGHWELLEKLCLSVNQPWNLFTKLKAFETHFTPFNFGQWNVTMCLCFAFVKVVDI